MAPAKEPRRLTHQDVEDLTTDLHDEACPTTARLLAFDAVNGLTGLCECCDDRTSYHLLITRDDGNQDFCVYCVVDGSADDDDTFALSELWEDAVFKHRIASDQAFSAWRPLQPAWPDEDDDDACCDRHALNADHDGPCAAWLDSDDSDDGCEVVE